MPDASRRWLLVPTFVVFGGAIWLMARGCATAPTSAPATTRTTGAPSSGPSDAPLRDAEVSASGCALLDGLTAGDWVGEWTVSRVVINSSIEDKPQLAIDLERKGSGITIWVTRRENVVNPPLATEKYALAFGNARPYGEKIPDDAFVQTMNAIAARVRRTEKTKEPPNGL